MKDLKNKKLSTYNEVKELMSIISEGQDSEQRRKIENFIQYQLQLIESQDKEIEKLKKEKEYWIDYYEVLNELRISLLEYLNCDKNDYHGDLTIKTHDIDTEFLRGYSNCADDYYRYISGWKITNDGEELIEKEILQRIEDIINNEKITGIEAKLMIKDILEGIE